MRKSKAGRLDPDTITNPATGVRLEDRFLRYVDKRADGHWIWCGGRRSREGAGTFGVSKGNNRSPAEVSYRLYRGAIPAGTTLLPCPQGPDCCNPEHLTLWKGWIRVSRKARAVLPDVAVAVAESRRRVTQAALARKYGVTRQMISLVLLHKMNGSSQPGCLSPEDCQNIRASYYPAETLNAAAKRLGVSGAMLRKYNKGVSIYNRLARSENRSTRFRVAV